MAQINSTRASRDEFRAGHPGANLVVAVVVGGIGLAFFALYVWLFLGRGAPLP